LLARSICRAHGATNKSLGLDLKVSCTSSFPIREVLALTRHPSMITLPFGVHRLIAPVLATGSLRELSVNHCLLAALLCSTSKTHKNCHRLAVVLESKTSVKILRLTALASLGLFLYALRQ